MKLIRIVSGVYGHRPSGSRFVEPKRVGDPPFEVASDKAARLVELNVAEYVEELESVSLGRVATGSGDDNTGKGDKSPPEDHNPLEDEFDDDDDDQGEDELPEIPEYNTDMKMDELREILNEFGIPFKVGMSKEDVVTLLDEFFEVADDELDDEFPGFSDGDVVP